MRKIHLVLPVLLLMLFACTNSNEIEQKAAIGGKMYGGEIKFLSPEKVKSLNPIETADIYSQRINGQIFETLLKIDQSTMEVVPSIAESYTVSKDAKVFTFKIRKGIKFHEDDCLSGGSRELVAADVKFALEVACSGLPNNQVSYLLIDRIKGAKEFNSNTKKALSKSGVSGIKAKGNYELEIELIKPFMGFEKILTHTSLGVYPKEAFDEYGSEIAKHPVGTGPFMLESFDDKGISLQRNPNYWKKDELGNQLPFLSKISMSYVKDKKSELMAFRNKEIDLVLEIPVEEIEYVFGTLQEAQEGKNVKHKVESVSSMNINYMGLACESAEFKDVRVRKAFNMAINRNEIINKYLLGEGWACKNGFVPAMDNYPAKEVKGFEFNAAKAQALLAEAGYKNGENFPALDFYVNAVKGSSAYKMCEGIRDQIKANLNITLNIKLCTYDEREAAVAKGDAKIWRTGWIADYPDAENFLSMFSSANMSSTINPFKFKSEAYDALLLKAQHELDGKKRTEMLVKCDQMIVDNAPVMPILTEDFMLLMNARVRDMKVNAMETLDFSAVYIKEPKK